MWTWRSDVAGPCRPPLLYFRSVASLAGLLNAETPAAAVLRVCSFPFFPSPPPRDARIVSTTAVLLQPCRIRGTSQLMRLEYAEWPEADVT